MKIRKKIKKIQERRVFVFLSLFCFIFLCLSFRLSFGIYLFGSCDLVLEIYFLRF
jgi:hypothetical protein